MKNQIVDFSVFVDGKGFVGTTNSVTPPELSINYAEHRAGGMDGVVAIDMGLNRLETSFEIAEYSEHILSRFGLVKGGVVPITIRGARQTYDGTVTKVEMKMNGNITAVSRGTWTAGEIPTMSVTMTLDYYQEIVAGKQVIEVDVINKIRKISGTDQMAKLRKAIGM